MFLYCYIKLRIFLGITFQIQLIEGVAMTLCNSHYFRLGLDDSRRLIEISISFSVRMGIKYFHTVSIWKEMFIHITQ